MDTSIQSQFQRAEELLDELEREYKNALTTQEVTDRAKNITHEILLKIRSILDHVFYQYFKKRFAPNLSDEEVKKARIYFPIVNSDQSLKSTLERAKMNDLDRIDPKVYNFIKSIQPYRNSSYKWLELLNRYAVEGKHIRLTPQKKQTQERISVESVTGGRVVWDPKNVQFGPGVRIFGASVDPSTQNIIPIPGVESRREIWVSFNFEGTNINAFGLCKESLQKSRKLVEKFIKLF